MLARLSEYQILSERVASLSIHWPPRRSVDHSSRKYDLRVLRGADRVVVHLAEASGRPVGHFDDLRDGLCDDWLQPRDGRVQDH